jgi:hypothetical protein
MSLDSARRSTHRLFQDAAPLLRVQGLDRTRNRWKVHRPRNPDDKRIGPWHYALVNFLDETLRLATRDCLYLVKAGDGEIRYVGVGQTLQVRWRRPKKAFLEGSDEQVRERPIFHNRCWPKIEEEGRFPYEVRVLAASRLREAVRIHGEGLFGHALEIVDDEAFVNAVESVLRRYRSSAFPGSPLFVWNER